jgi:hypothetical protein
MKIKKTEEITPEVISENISEEEKTAIAEQENVSVASTEKIALANELLAHQFNIDETFHVTKVDDKGKSLTLGFANLDYEVTIKIKDTEEMGIIPPEI